ncbi:NAD(P)/FAD-dependent oxidoreductase [Paracoccus caeni]|uniref:NAD(P)/FAD-dependent oxidoreductase n=1 Tax=Paracoccus caeni TaxID=657651 RepID=UPI002D801D4F|nr:FAD-binding oxidoreductase [Paracoccus caeni]
MTIIGGGIFGLCCAWEMSRRGASVRVIEADRIGAGSSGGHVGALAPHAPDNWNPKKAFQLESLLMAGSFWRDVEAASGQPTGYLRAGRLQPLTDPDEAARLQARITASQDRWPTEMQLRLTDRPDAALIPDSPIGLWLVDGLTARINPRAALSALTQALRRSGAEVIEGQRPDPDALTGTTLWATGTPGLLDLTDALGRNIGKGVKGQSALLRHAAPNAPQVFADGLHIVPHQDGTVAIGSTSENEYGDLQHDERLDEIIARARQLCPALADAPVIDRWAGARARAKSRAPLLGHWPGREGHFVANGGFKIGFGMAPKIAALMANLILTGQDAIPEGFRL